MMTILDMIYYSLQNKLSFYFTLKFTAKIIVSVQEIHFYCFKCFLLCFDTLICILSFFFFFFFLFMYVWGIIWKCTYMLISLDQTRPTISSDLAQQIINFIK